jgi:predicted acetyltransferase
VNGALELALPGERFEPSYLEAQRELLAEGKRPEELVTAETFPALLRRLADARANVVLPGKVGATTFWLVEGETYLGRISIRHDLTDSLRVFGGHIGYDIRRSRRGQGLGGQMLALALPYAYALGIDPAMLTCDAANIASWRMIERCGGTREAAYEHEGATRWRYWIPTRP